MTNIPVSKRPSAIELGFVAALTKKKIRWNTRRQFSYTNYVGKTKYIKPDICIDKLRLAIEIDGQQHFEAEQQRIDALRDGTIRSQGYEVLRITTQELNNQTRFHEIVDELANLYHEGDEAEFSTNQPVEEAIHSFKPVEDDRSSVGPPKVGEEFYVTIEAVGENGDGIAKRNGFVLFIPGAKEGQQVCVRVTKVLRTIGFAKNINVADDESSSTKKSFVSKLFGLFR